MKTISRFFLLVLCLALVAGCAPATPMPTATVTPIPSTATPLPTPTEVPATATPAPTPVPEVKPEWTFDGGGPIESPVIVAEGVVYFGSEDGYLYAVNLATHDLKWKFKTDGSVRSSTAVTADTVYTASDDSYLYAVSKSDGSMLWKQQIEKEAMKRDTVLSLSNMDAFTSSPVVQDTTLYIGSTDGNLYALDAPSGKILWKFATDRKWMIRNTPSIADGMVFFGDFSGDFYAVDAKDGTMVWKHTDNEGTLSNGMAFVDHVLYFNTIFAFRAVNAKTGFLKWSSPTSDMRGWISSLTPAFENGILYTDGYFRPIAAYKASTGMPIWEAPDFGSYRRW